jgi:cytochrome c peroxidase
MAGFPNSSGMLRTYSATGDIDLAGAFFQNLGSNGRTCATCHQPGDGMSVSAAHIQYRFNSTQGMDPIFRTNDGSDCDHDIDTSTIAGRSKAYSLLRTRGLLRIALPVPANADFEIVSVQNPYGCGETDIISTYRRPLPATNLKFLSALMWDGRESAAQGGTTPINSGNYPQALLANLAHQSIDATLGHALGTQAPTEAQQQEIVDFEMGLSTAQAEVHGAGDLSAHGATGGPKNVAAQEFFIGINDPVGLNPRGTPFTSTVFNLFEAWRYDSNSRRAAIVRGEDIFNTRTFTISGVGGLNGATFGTTTVPESLPGTCGTCHDSPNAGDHSVAAPLNIGIATADNPTVNPLDLGYLPRITLRNLQTGAMVTTTDPGRALITGKFDDVARFKGPVLRGLAARAPYFHNGAAHTLMDVVRFYDVRFGIALTEEEKSDLVAFLSAL